MESDNNITKQNGSRFLLLVSFFLLLLLPRQTKAQCQDWYISAQLVSGSTCAANGSFAVTVSGPDAGNLSNIQYAVPATGSYAVPLNNSPLFTSVPGGAWQVSAVATCNGNFVGKNTGITMPGNYQLPLLKASTGRNTLSCGSYGRINTSVENGRAPFTINLTGTPAGYTGPISFTTSSSAYVIENLAAGNYTIQIIDACGSGTAPQSLNISSLTPSSLPMQHTSGFGMNGCNILIAPKPYVLTNNNGWGGYPDTLFRISAEISNGVSPPSGFETWSNSFTLPLAAGKTLRDCYGQTLRYTIRPACGPDFQITRVIPYPDAGVWIDQNCNIDFKAQLSFNGFICFPVTYTITGNGNTYGPFTSTTQTAATPSLPIGNYSLSFTTADGYTGSTGFGTTQISGSPYSISLLFLSAGIHNYADGFRISTTVSSSVIKTVELFSAPPGYTFNGTWNVGNYYDIYQNQSPSASTLKFPPGLYVWKITDNCGTYLVPLTVTPADLNRFSTGMDSMVRTCTGLQIWPSATVTRNGQTTPVSQYLLYEISRDEMWSFNTAFLVTAPGDYIVLPVSGTANRLLYDYLSVNRIAYPNIYTNGYRFSYNLLPLQADMDQSQGFICMGSGQGEIHIKAKGGNPYMGTGYRYALADSGKGVSGPFTDSNTTGIFTGFGANAGEHYDVRIRDSCGRFIIQPLEILDLRHQRFISSSTYVACDSARVELSALYLPNASYSWTGPNGFTSSLRNPVIEKIDQRYIGVYKVSVTTPLCGQPFTDSTIITSNIKPPVPQLALSCGPPVSSLTVLNPLPGIDYKWEQRMQFPGWLMERTLESDTGYTKYTDIGWFKAIATDTSTKCVSYSDSICFAYSDTNFKASIYAPHLDICPGDSTTLVAQGYMTGIPALPAPVIQWYRDGLPVPGAVHITHATDQPGNYKVLISVDTCTADTSEEVTVRLISLPAVSLKAADTNLCSGDTTVLEATAGTGFSYTWNHNGSTVPGAASPVLRVSQPGDYFVTVANTGCAVISDTVTLNVQPKPVAQITPGTPQFLCDSNAVIFSTPSGTGYVYTWERDGNIIPGAGGNTYSARTEGRFSVRVSTAYCPDVSSDTISVTRLPSSVELGNDTIICAGGGFAIPLSAPPDFDRYLWSDGTATPAVTARTAGIWWVRVSNYCGVFTDTIRINSVTDYLPGLPADTLVCNEANSLTVSINPLLQHIMWSTGAATPEITIGEPGIYRVQGESPCGTMHDSIEVRFCAPEILHLGVPDNICAGDCISLSAQTGNFPQSYEWLFPGGNPAAYQGQQPGSICYGEPGTFPITLTVRNAGGSVTETARITVLPFPAPRFSDTSAEVSYGTELVLPACAGAATADWYRNDTLICTGCPVLQLKPLHWKSVYQCVVSNGNCADTCTYLVTTRDIPSDISMPTAFTPDGDGRNDYFRIVTGNPNIHILDLSVYNRWGQKIYSGNDPRGWDGRHKGAPAEGGTYFWYLKYGVNGSEKTWEQKGDITLIR